MSTNPQTIWEKKLSLLAQFSDSISVWSVPLQNINFVGVAIAVFKGENLESLSGDWNGKLSTQTYHSAMADARELYSREIEEQLNLPSLDEATTLIEAGVACSRAEAKRYLRLARQKEREACASLVRAAGCLCHALGHAKGDFTSNFLGVQHYDETLDNGFGAWVLDKHDPRCPEALAEMIEKGEK